MKFIDKINSAYSASGNRCSQDEIDLSWNSADRRHIGLEYRLSENVKKLREVLVKEQNALCCYCMRKLLLGDLSCNVTLEHIVPHKITEKQWDDEKQSDEYFKFPCLKSDYISICYKAELTNPEIKISGLPHPHFISYYNLVASCDGGVLQNLTSSAKVEPSHCCNNKRGNAFVKPVYLDASLVAKVGYEKDGTIDFAEDLEDCGIDGILNLNDIALKSVRKFWRCVAETEYAVLDIDAACGDKKLREEIIDDVSPASSTEWDFLKHNDSAWQWFSEYSWFYDYYKSKPAA